MGTYTTNYNLFMPTVGEQGWGTLINGNFTTIDTAMKGLDTRITAVENEVNGALNCTSVTTSGTVTSAGKITANGGVSGTTGTFSGTVTANKFVYSSAMTVTSSSHSVDIDAGCFTTLIPPASSIRYTGSVKYNASGASTATFRVVADNGAVSTVTLSGMSDTTYSFTKIRSLYVCNGMGARQYPKVYLPLIN